MREYTSKDDLDCTKCGEKIKAGTKYHLLKRYIMYKGERVGTFERVHVKCPNEDGLRE